MTTFIRSLDGRRLAVNEAGNPAGHPVVYLHGTPGSRVGPFPPGRVLEELGVRLISYDRPGYGGSPRQPGRRVADAARDVEAIADELGLSKFAVIGRSGGGPHALACASLLPGRVTKAAALVSPAPREAEGLDWFAGMAESNVREYTMAATAPELLAVTLEQVADEIKADPASFVSTLETEMPEADRRVVGDTGIREMLAENYAEALRHSAAGWIDDALALCSPWGFSLSGIHVPVLLWHGEDDRFSPVTHAFWLAGRIPGAQLRVGHGAGHFGALKVVPDVLAWLIRQN